MSGAIRTVCSELRCSLFRQITLFSATGLSVSLLLLSAGALQIAAEPWL
jgi:hypothetical protein